jgi:hypothetical protein
MATRIKFLNWPSGDVKMAPQEKAILEEIETVGDATRKEIVETLDKAIAAEKIKSKQTGSTLLAYYRQRLIDRKCIEVYKEDPPKKDDKEDDSEGDKAAA